MLGGLQNIQLQCSCHTTALGRIGSSAVRNMALQDVLRGAIDRASRVVEEQLLLLRGHLREEIARLLPVIILYAVVIVTSIAFQRERQLSVFRLAVPQPLAIRVVTGRRSEVPICAHLAIPVIGVKWTLRSIHRDVIEVDTEAVSLGISIRKQAALKHLVRREANSGNHIRRGGGGLLHFCEVGFRITIELHYTNFDQWVVGLWPDFRQVKRIVLVRFRLFLRHDLDEERPTRKISAFDCVEKISAIALPIICKNRRRSFVREILNTLLCAEVELHPSALVVGIDHRESMTSEAVHIPEGLWNSAVGHNDCDLMECLRKKRPEVPVILRAPQTGAGVALDSGVKVRKAERIAEEKHRAMFSEDHPISFLG